MKKTSLALLLLLALPAWAQNGSKIVTDANATGQTGAMQTGARAAAVTFTFCGTGFSGVLAVDSAATSAALAQVWTTTLAGNSDCTTTYAYSPASKWYRVRWTRTAGTLNIWMNIQTGDVMAGAITGPVGGLTAGRVALSGGATGITDDANLTFATATDTLTTKTVAANNVVVTALATPTITSPLVVNGTPGVVTYGYKRVDYLADGTSTAASAEVTIATGNATLSAVNSITIGLPALAGSVSTRLYRTTGGAAPPKLIYTGTATTFDDIGAAGTAQTPATVDGTGVVTTNSITAPLSLLVTAGTTPYAFGTGGAFDIYAVSAQLRLGPSVDTILTRSAPATFQLGSLNVTGAVAPVAQTLTVQSVGTTATADLAGADWTHKGSFGKGTAASGKHIFTVGTPQNTTVAHTSSTVLTLQDTGTAGVAKPQALFAAGTIAAPSAAVGYVDNGLSSTASSVVDMSVAGVQQMRWASSTVNGVSVVNPGGLNIANGANETRLSNPGTSAVLQLGAAASATPVAQTLQAQGSRGGTDTDVAGANLTIRPGAGTGAAAGASLLLQTPSATSTGTTAQTHATRLTLSEGGAQVGGNLFSSSTDAHDLGNSSNRLWRTLTLSRATLGSKTKALTDAGAVAFASFTIADAAMYSGEIIYNVKSTKGTAIQVLAGRARFVATREGSTYTVAISEVGTQTLAAAAGTLTGAISIAGTGGVVTLTATFDTSQSSPDSMAINYRFDSPEAALAITFP